MTATQVRITGLTDWDACRKARNEIENDLRNVEGGAEAWDSGRTTYLKPAAQRKVDAIERKMQEFAEADED